MTYCELFIPTVGTIFSQPGNKTFPPWESTTRAGLSGRYYLR